MAESADSEGPERFAARLIGLEAALARGLADAEAKRLKSSSEVFDRLEARLADEVERLPSSSKRPKDLSGAGCLARLHKPKMVPRKGLGR